MFGKKKPEIAATEPGPTAPHVAKKATSANAGEAASRLLESIRENRNLLAARETEAQEALARTEKKHAIAVAEYDAAEEKFCAAESEDSAKALRAARETRDLTEIQLRRSRKMATDAIENLRVAEEGVKNATAAAECAKRIEELQPVASVENFQKRARPITERFMRARAEMHSALDELVANFNAANSAADELRDSLGVPAERLDRVQLISQYCIMAAEKDPVLADGFIRELQGPNHVPSASGGAFGRKESLKDSLIRLLMGHPQSLVDLAGRSGLTKEDRAGRGDASGAALDIAELHDFFRDTRGAWAERVKARREEQKQKRHATSKSERKEAARAARLAAAESR